MNFRWLKSSLCTRCSGVSVKHQLYIDFMYVRYEDGFWPCGNVPLDWINIKKFQIDVISEKEKNLWFQWNSWIDRIWVCLHERFCFAGSKNAVICFWSGNPHTEFIREILARKVRMIESLSNTFLSRIRIQIDWNSHISHITHYIIWEVRTLSDESSTHKI